MFGWIFFCFHGSGNKMCPCICGGVIHALVGRYGRHTTLRFFFAPKPVKCSGVFARRVLLIPWRHSRQHHQSSSGYGRVDRLKVRPPTFDKHDDSAFSGATSPLRHIAGAQPAHVMRFFMVRRQSIEVSKCCPRCIPFSAPSTLDKLAQRGFPSSSEARNTAVAP